MQAMSRVTNRKTYGILWLLLPAFLVLASCATTSTKFTDVWRDKAFEGQFTRMLIIGAAEDQNVRAFYEASTRRPSSRQAAPSAPTRCSSPRWWKGER
jgi:hypothetical protein